MKTGLKTEINKHILPLFLLLNINLQAQIPVNGFVKYDNNFTVPGNKALLSLNFNNDSYTDLLLFNPNRRDAYLLEGNGTGDFNKTIAVKFRHPPSNIRNLSFKGIYSRLFVSVSRKDRTASLVSFTKGGEILILDQYKFDSYPEKIDVSDIDLDQSPDVLVAGSAFEGISILQIKNGKIFENKVLDKSFFRTASFMDFNHDGFDDIAAVNLFSSELEFYENDSRGNYKYSRSLKINNLPSVLNSLDIDLDYYDDVVCSENRSIHIFFGDALSAYDKQIDISTLYTPHLIVNGDFNGDGNIDIVYADTVSGSVSAIFGKDNREFSEELLLLKKNNITALIPYYSKFITSVAVLNYSGNLFSISRLRSVASDLNLTAGIHPGAVNYFDYLDNGITDLCYIDEEQSTINFLLRNAEGTPDKLYYYKLHFPQKEIITDSYSKEIKVFYCWTRGSKLIEIVTADFGNNKFTKQSLYSTGGIRDLKIQSRQGDPAVVYATYIDEGFASANVFEFHNFRYIRADYKSFASDAVDISSFITQKGQGFFVWQRRDSLILYSYDINNLSSPARIGASDFSELVITCTGDIFNDGLASQFALLKDNGESSVIISGRRFNRITSIDTFDITGFHQLWFGTARPGGLNKLWVYLPGKRNLNLITLFNKGKNLILSEKISEITVNRYFVRNMSILGYHIVYSNPEENCITIKRLE